MKFCQTQLALLIKEETTSEKKEIRKETNCDDFSSSSVGSQAPISLASLDFITNYNLITKKADTMSGDNETEQLEGAVADIDLGVAVILANDDLVGDEEESIVLTIGKSFDL